MSEIVTGILRRNPEISSRQLQREDMEGRRDRDGGVLVFTPRVSVNVSVNVGVSAKVNVNVNVNRKVKGKR